MKTFTLAQTQEAQVWRPQLERFICDGQIVVVESPSDYDTLPSDVQDILSLREQL